MVRIQQAPPGRSRPAARASLAYPKRRRSVADSRDSTRSTSCADVLLVGAPPIASPRSAALAALRSVSDSGVGSPVAVRSGTSRRNQARMNATPAIGTAVRNTGCSARL